MTDLGLNVLRKIAEAGVAAGADKPGTYYGPLATALDPLPVTTIELIDEIERLRGQAEKLASTLADFLDDEPCEFDHHGYCQMHGWLDEGECSMSRARRILDGAGAGESDE